MTRLKTIPLIVASLSVATVSAQQQPGPPPKPEAQQKAIAAIDYMVGNWSGEGWMDVGGGRRATFRGTEVVQRKLDGTVLLVEGNFLANIPGVESEVPVHTTLGVISFDPQTKKYRFTTWLATGTSGERELTLLPKGWQWEIRSARGIVRYAMTLTDTGEWLEIGERSPDGAAWQQFFEMKLRK